MNEIVTELHITRKVEGSLHGTETVIMRGQDYAWYDDEHLDKGRVTVAMDDVVEVKEVQTVKPETWGIFDEAVAFAKGAEDQATEAGLATGGLVTGPVAMGHAGGDVSEGAIVYTGTGSVPLRDWLKRNGYVPGRFDGKIQEYNPRRYGKTRVAELEKKILELKEQAAERARYVKALQDEIQTKNLSIEELKDTMVEKAEADKREDFIISPFTTLPEGENDQVCVEYDDHIDVYDARHAVDFDWDTDSGLLVVTFDEGGKTKHRGVIGITTRKR